MTRVLSRKSSFTSGEISPELYGRSDLNAYRNGAKTLRNVLLRPTGGVRRRPGLAHVATVMAGGRLVPFEIGAGKTYFLHLHSGHGDIYRDGRFVHSIRHAPWEEHHIPDIAWVQNTDSLLLTHPDFEPYLIRYQGEGADGSDLWGHRSWRFDKEESFSHAPFFRFIEKDDDRSVTMTITGVGRAYHRRTRTYTRTAHITCSKAIFEDRQFDRLWMIDGVQYELMQIIPARVGDRVSKKGQFRIIGRKEKTDEGGYRINTSPRIVTGRGTTDWMESAFSDFRGWPTCCTFYQGRLVIGGSKSIPNRIWMSQPGRHGNFDTGWGQANDAIAFDLLSDQANDIRTLFAGRHLQIFTSGAEWVVTADVLTPTGLTVRRQSRIGIFDKRRLPPSNIDGATVFIDRSGKQVREFLYTDIEQAYQTTDLALLSSHMIVDPLDQAFDPGRRHLYIPLGRGTMAVATIHRAEQVTGWTMLETAGKFLSVTLSGGNVYVLVEREKTKTSSHPVREVSYPAYSIERFDDTLYLDAALSAERDGATRQWSDFSHLRDHPSVRVLADGVSAASGTIDRQGNLTLAEPARRCTLGLAYTHSVIPLPPAEGYARMRLIHATFHIEQSESLRADTGTGYRTTSLFRTGQSPMGDPILPSTRTVRFLGRGWHRGEKPLWRIDQSAAEPFSLLSVTSEIKVAR